MDRNDPHQQPLDPDPEAQAHALEPEALPEPGAAFLDTLRTAAESSRRNPALGPNLSARENYEDRKAALASWLLSVFPTWDTELAPFAVWEAQPPPEGDWLQPSVTVQLKAALRARGRAADVELVAAGPEAVTFILQDGAPGSIPREPTMPEPLGCQVVAWKERDALVDFTPMVDAGQALRYVTFSRHDVADVARARLYTFLVTPNAGSTATGWSYRDGFDQQRVDYQRTQDWQRYVAEIVTPGTGRGDGLTRYEHVLFMVGAFTAPFATHPDAALDGQLVPEHAHTVAMGLLRRAFEAKRNPPAS